MLFVEVAELGRIGHDDWAYLQAKRKLVEFKQRPNLIVVTTKEAARGVDF